MAQFLRYPIRPMAHAISTDFPSLFMEPGFSPWVLNGRIVQGSFQKRWGYTLDRQLAVPVYGIVLYQKIDGTRYTLYMTETDIIKKETTGSWSYITDTNTTPVVTSMNPAKTAITFSDGGITASGVAMGDKFIIDADHTADEEPDAHWSTILRKDSDTQITLVSPYIGAATTGTCKLRKVYATPANERWSTAVVDDIICFTNGSNDVLTWNGSGYVTALSTSYAKNARYCTEYANRLVLADCTSGGIRKPLTIKWSKEGDPTDWTDSTAGEADLLETDDYITGIGKVGANLIVYKRSSLNIYSRSGVATSPLTKVGDRPGIGLVAPYSLVQYAGTNFFIGRRNFYYMNGDMAEPFGDKIKDKFFDIVGDTEVRRVLGGVNTLRNEILWLANTSEGAYAFVYDIEKAEWSVDQFAHNMNAFGTGAV